MKWAAAALAAIAAWAVALMLIWLPGQLAGLLADHWPPVSYPIGALGELWALFAHPTAIGPGVPAVGFWVYLLLEMAGLAALAIRTVRSTLRHRLSPWTPPAPASRPDAPFGAALDAVAARERGGRA
jgi:hypothetical protein